MRPTTCTPSGRPCSGPRSAARSSARAGEHALAVEMHEGAHDRLARGDAFEAGARQPFGRQLAAREQGSELGRAELVQRLHLCPRVGGRQL
ncbi:MAG TPA: hypothetical protein VEH51_01750 [Burkholderiales bacterium]|nr:hypothetical protein [Burkholderiales bacterium]